jgi:hypothetical protein
MEQGNRMLEGKERQYWGIWAAAAKRVNEYWQAEASHQILSFPQQLREQGKIGLANRGKEILMMMTFICSCRSNNAAGSRSKPGKRRCNPETSSHRGSSGWNGKACGPKRQQRKMSAET